MDFQVFVICALFSVVACLRGDCESECPQIVSRKAWGGRTPTQIDYALIPVEYVIIQHTVTPECTTESDCKTRMRSMQNYHMDTLEYPDLAMNFVIGGDGKVYEGRGWHKVGAHTRGYNSRSIGVSFVGDFREKMPNTQQLNAAKKLFECGVCLGELKSNYKLIAARQVSATESPGLKLYQEIQKWNHYYNTN